LAFKPQGKQHLFGTHTFFRHDPWACRQPGRHRRWAVRLCWAGFQSG
jgi:hypothetical protein